MSSGHVCSAECVTDQRCPRFTGGRWQPYLKITSPRAPIARSSSEPLVHPIEKKQIFITGTPVRFEVGELGTLSISPPIPGTVSSEFQIESRHKINDTLRLPTPGNYIVQYQIDYIVHFDPKITPGTSFRIGFHLTDGEDKILDESVQQSHTPFDEDYPDHIGRISSFAIISVPTTRFGLSLHLSNFNFSLSQSRYIILSSRMLVEKI